MKIELIEREPNPICMFCLAGRNKMLKINIEMRTDVYWVCTLCANTISTTMRSIQERTTD